MKVQQKMLSDNLMIELNRFSIYTVVLIPPST